MKILIIGSKGFIGSACYAYFKSNSSLQVFGADVVIEYNDPNYFLVDASNSDFKEIFRQNSFDFCINCAGAASVPDSIIHPLRDYLLNVHHLALLLNAIKEENPQCMLLQLSSAAVYGNPKVQPIKEDHPTVPVSPYGLHKLQAEELAEMYVNNYQIKVCVLRVFSAYGPGLKKQLFWDLHQKSMKGKTLQLYGTGKETREFIYIDDIIKAMEVIMNAGLDGFHVFNIANAESITIEKAATLFLEYIGFDGNFSFNGVTREGDPLYWQADTTLLKNLGYQQNVSFEVGLNNYCKWVQETE